MDISGQLHAQAALPPEVEPLVPIEYETGLAPEPVWTQRGGEEKFHHCLCRELNLGRPAPAPSNVLYHSQYQVLSCIPLTDVTCVTLPEFTCICSKPLVSTVSFSLACRSHARYLGSKLTPR